MGHNFHVEWHLIFGVEMREKAWLTPRVTIHQRPEICQLGMQFVHKWLRKRPYALYKSCRGLQDLQLSSSYLGALLFQNFEKNSFENRQTKFQPHPPGLCTPERGEPRHA
jgi:hypothetical protein